MSNNCNEKRVVDYFAIVGLNKSQLREYPDITQNADKDNYKRDPIVDLTIIDKTLDEKPPKGYECITKTPSGYPADLNHGSLKAHVLYLCYRRGRDKPPITDIGVLYEDRERLIDGCCTINETYYGNSANLNNGSMTGNRVFLTYKRAAENACNTLAAIDICVIVKSKGEMAPHSFNEIQKNLNRSFFGATLYICYKKAVIPAIQIKYLPNVLFRYPINDYDDIKFPDLANFGLPMGAVIEAWPKSHSHNQQSPWLFSTFVLNINEDGNAEVQKVYGASLSFYENYDQNNLTKEQEAYFKNSIIISTSNQQTPSTPPTSPQSNDSNSQLPPSPLSTSSSSTQSLQSSVQSQYILKSNKCILLLSRHPFFEAFKRFLLFLYQTVYKSNKKSYIPIERYISHLFNKVPFPSIEKPSVWVHLNKDFLNEHKLTIYLPEENILPQTGASFTELLRTLGADNCLNVLLFVLLQKKVMIHSLKPALLTVVVEAISCIIFPFMWRYAYIPMCPLNIMTLMIDAPLSFIIGMDSRYFDMFETPSNVICVDLDTNSISWTEDRKNISTKQLPKKAVNVLKNRLNELYNEYLELIRDKMQQQHAAQRQTTSVTGDDSEIKIKKRERSLELSIREAFLRFMAALLYNYKNYLRYGTRRPDIKAVDRNLDTYYDREGFVRSKENSTQIFYKELVRTQLFYDFIMNISFASEVESTLADALAFFDECCSKINPNADKDDHRLLDLNVSLSDQTIFITPPEALPSDNQDGYEYNRFPSQLDLNNFDDKTKEPISNKKSLKTPNTPMGVRTKAEKISSQKKLQNKFSVENNGQRSAKSWAYCILSNAYALWFIYLPSYVELCESKANALNYAFKILVRMQKQLLTQPDEICYRVLMQLCLLYKLPTIAVKTLLHMRKYNIDLNYITYSYYNKVLIEGDWPSFERDRWGKLRTLINSIRAFKYALKLRQEKMKQLSKAQRKLSHQLNSSRNAKEGGGATVNANKSLNKHNHTSNASNNKSNNKLDVNNKTTNSCSSQSQSITCSLSSIAEPDKSSIDKVSRDSIDSGAYLNNDRVYPNSIEFFNNGSFDVDVKNPLMINNNLKAINNSSNNKTLSKQHSVEHSLMKKSNTDGKMHYSSSSTNKTESAQIKKNRQMFDLKLKSQTSIVKRKSNLQTKNDSKFSNAIHVNSIGILLTNESLVDDDKSKNKLLGPLNSNKSTIKAETNKSNNKDDISANSINCEDETNNAKLRRYHSDDSIYLNQITTMIGKLKNFKLNSNEKAENIVENEKKPKAVIEDPLGAYLGTDPLSALAAAPIQIEKPADESLLTSNQNVISSSLDEKRKKLFDYKPFEAERVEEAAATAAAKIANIQESVSNNHICDKCNNHHDECDERDDEDEENYDNSDMYENEEESYDDEEEDEENEGIEEEDEDGLIEDDESKEQLDEISAYKTDERKQESSVLMESFRNPIKSFMKIKNFELTSKLKDKLTVIKSTIQTQLPASISQQDIADKLKSFSGYTINTNLLTSAFNNNNNNNNNSANTSLNGYYFNGGKLNKNLKSNDSISSQTSTDDIDMPEPYEIEDIYPFEIDLNTLNDLLINIDMSSCNFSSSSTPIDITVPYLSPLFLRKEIENIINNERLTINQEFMDKHSVIFWNLFWYFKRIDLHSELPVIVLNSRIKNLNKIINNESINEDSANAVKEFTIKNSNLIRVNCKWDNLVTSSDAADILDSFYKNWKYTLSPTKGLNSLLNVDAVRLNIKQTIIDITEAIKNNDVSTPIKILLRNRERSKILINSSIYREILFLSIVVLKREQIDIDAFDREYRRAYKSLSIKMQELVEPCDRPTNNTMIWCRRLFSPLNL